MHEIWHKPVLRPMFRLLGAVGILVGKAGHDVPTTVSIRPAPEGQYYRRVFRFDPPVRFSSMNAYHRRTDRVVEWVGPGKSLGMAWDVTFQQPATLLLVTSGWLIRLGRRELSIPGWLWPWTLGRADTIQRADPDLADTIHIELILHHALFGETFRFSGMFRVVAPQIPGAASRVQAPTRQESARILSAQRQRDDRDMRPARDHREPGPVGWKPGRSHRTAAHHPGAIGEPVRAPPVSAALRALVTASRWR